MSGNKDSPVQLALQQYNVRTRLKRCIEDIDDEKRRRGFMKVIFEDSNRGLPTVDCRYIVFQSRTHVLNEDTDMRAVMESVPQLAELLETYDPRKEFIIFAAYVFVGCNEDKLKQQGCQLAKITFEQLNRFDNQVQDALSHTPEGSAMQT